MCRKRSPFFENPSSLNTVCRLPLNHSHLSLAAPRPDPRRPQRVPRHEKSRAWCLKHSLEMPQVRGRDFWWQVTVLWTQVTGNMMDNHKVSVYLCSMYVSISDYKTSLLVRSLEVSIPLNLSSVYTRRDIAARCRGAMDAENGLQRNQPVCQQGRLHGAIWRDVTGRHNDAPPEMFPAHILSRRSATSPQIP